MLSMQWLQNQDHIVYTKVDEFAGHFGMEMGIDDFRQKLEDFKANPVKEGIQLKGKKRSTFKMFIPDLYFEEKEEKLDMGDSVWIYFGDLYPCYCVYWPR